VGCVGRWLVRGFYFLFFISVPGHFNLILFNGFWYCQVSGTFFKTFIFFYFFLIQNGTKPAQNYIILSFKRIFTIFTGGWSNQTVSSILQTEWPRRARAFAPILKFLGTWEMEQLQMLLCRRLQSHIIFNNGLHSSGKPWMRLTAWEESVSTSTLIKPLSRIACKPNFMCLCTKLCYCTNNIYYWTNNCQNLFYINHAFAVKNANADVDWRSALLFLIIFPIIPDI